VTWLKLRNLLVVDYLSSAGIAVISATSFFIFSDGYQQNLRALKEDVDSP
jgi:hypothetical protein